MSESAPVAERVKSPGHLGWSGEAEYYLFQGNVYRASESSVFDVTTGQRIGRWECSEAHYERFRALYESRYDKEV